MVRSLLKRKLKIANLKKLKTVGYRFTSLSQWAQKQLSKKQSTYLSLPYPRKLILKSRLHRRQLLSQLLGNFSLSQTHIQGMAKQSTLGKYDFLVGKRKEIVFPTKAAQSNDITNKPKSAFPTGKANLPRKAVLGSFLPATALPKVSWVDKNLKASTHVRYLLDDTQPVLSNNISAKPNEGFMATSQPLSFPFRSSRWPAYVLKLKSTKNRAKIYSSNFKSLYSLDQLMCHQYDAQRQFVRRVSSLKSSLREKQKLTALYGKISKKQWKKWFKKNHITQKGSNQLTFLESRLDIALKRCFVFNTLRLAQHWISQGRILVNHKVITSPFYILQPGDVMSIGEAHKDRYRIQFLSFFYKIPKESKYIQSGTLLKRWRDWAVLYNSLAQHYREALQRKNKQLTLPGARLTSQGRDKMPKVWPNLAIQNFWYQSGRAIFKCLHKEHANLRPLSLARGHGIMRPKVRSSGFMSKRLGVENLVRWLKRRRWRMASWARERQAKRRNFRFHFTHWKDVYRRRVLLFSRWLLNEKPLIQDGLYFLRWHRGFIRKKSMWLRASHRQCAQQKGLQFEISYKKLCVIYLYPTQRILLPCLIDFRRI